MRMSKKTKVILYVILTLLAVYFLFPFVYMFFSTFKTESEAVAFPPKFLPDIWNWQNYVDAWNAQPFATFLKNSVTVTVLSALGSMVSAALVAYGFARFQFRGKNVLFMLLLSTMMIPWCVTIIPKYSMIQAFGWMDSYKALIIPAMFSGFGIFMMKQHISALPDEILEAARIDGANEFYIFHKIVLPMSKNGIFSIAIFQFLWAWEDFLWPYLVITNKDKQLLAVGLKMFNGQYSTDYGALFAATAISIIPVLLIYLFFQKQFIAGIAASAVKG